MAHIGFTPQSVNGLGGFRVQGRGDAAEQTVHDAIAVQEAGAFAVVMEMVPAELATQITGKLTIPTVGIGAGPNCDAQVLVWQDMAGMTAAGRRSSSSGSAMSAVNCAAPQRSTPTRWPQGRSPPRSTASRRTRRPLRQERGDALPAVGGVGAVGDQPALEFHLLFEAGGEGGEQQRLDRRRSIRLRWPPSGRPSARCARRVRRRRRPR